jgi:hypothetical protein
LFVDRQERLKHYLDTEPLERFKSIVFATVFKEYELSLALGAASPTHPP